MSELSEWLRACATNEPSNDDADKLWRSADLIEQQAEKITALEAQAYASTDKGPMLWKDICQEAFDTIEYLRRMKMRQLSERIYQQRARLRWWEDLFDQHVHAHWRKAQVRYFEIVRRDREAMYRKGFEAGRSSPADEGGKK